MAVVKFQGADVKIFGDLPKIGSALPSFSLIKTDLSTVTEKDFRGKTLVLNILPSIDTGVCSKSMIEFNEKIQSRPNVTVVGVSMDLPFAIARHDTQQKLKNTVGTSGFRSNFGETYGVKIIEGPLENLYTRAIVVADPEGKVTYTQLVEEITDAPDYSKALS